jgi:hypothetical protein
VKVTKNCAHCGTEFSAKNKKQACCSPKCGWAHKKIHGQINTPEYVSWRHMKQRCSNPKRLDYTYYGARGITVCERWHLFANFIDDMGLRPTIDHSLDRIDHNGNYELSNCRWATKLEQARNKRNTYTAEQDQKIREAVALGYNFPQIAKYVGKPERSVMARTYRIGLKSGTPPIPKKITSRSVA